MWRALFPQTSAALPECARDLLPRDRVRFAAQGILGFALKCAAAYFLCTRGLDFLDHVGGWVASWLVALVARLPLFYVFALWQASADRRFANSMRDVADRRRRDASAAHQLLALDAGGGAVAVPAGLVLSTDRRAP